MNCTGQDQQVVRDDLHRNLAAFVYRSKRFLSPKAIFIFSFTRVEKTVFALVPLQAAELGDKSVDALCGSQALYRRICSSFGDSQLRFRNDRDG